VGQAHGLSRPLANARVPRVEGNIIERGRNDHRQSAIRRVDERFEVVESGGRGVFGLGAKYRDVGELDDVEDLVGEPGLLRDDVRVVAGDGDLQPPVAGALDRQDGHYEG